MKHILVILVVGSLILGQSSLCIGALINGDGEFGDLTGWSASSAVASVRSQTVNNGTVNPFQGDWFFSFATSQAASAFMDQTGTMESIGGRAGQDHILKFRCNYETESTGVGEVVLTLLDAGDNEVMRETIGALSTQNLQWRSLSLDTVVPSAASSWKVQLNGTRISGDFVNVFFDNVQLFVVPEPCAVWTFVVGVSAMALSHRRVAEHARKRLRASLRSK